MVIDNRAEKVMEFVDEAVFPADDMPMRPPVFPVGMMGFSNKHIMEALGCIWLFTLPEDVQFIQPFEVELDGAVFGIDFK